jgi:glycosyltransferase involved in cell wall biosynthesis
LKTLAKEDRRIYFEEPLPADQVISKIQEYDAVAVPSRCLETGPLVVLEAFAASVPVLGAKLGGIAELVQHEVNGLLAEPDSVQSWITMIKRCVEDKSLLQHLRSGIHPPRNAKKVAAEMLELYRPVIIE